MPTIRILRGTFRQASGERAEPGDEIEVSERRLARLPDASYKVLGEMDPTTEEVPDAEVEPAGPNPDTEPDNATSPDEPVEPSAVDNRADDSDESPDEEATKPEPEPEPEPDVEAPGGADSEDVGDTTPTPDVPDDYAMLSKMAALYEGDEVHGSMSGDEITSFFEGLTPTEVNGLKRRASEEMS